MKKGDILEHFTGNFYEVLGILFEHNGIFKMIVIDEDGKKSIKYSYLFKGFENKEIDPIFIF